MCVTKNFLNLTFSFSPLFPKTLFLFYFSPHFPSFSFPHIFFPPYFPFFSHVHTLRLSIWRCVHETHAAARDPVARLSACCRMPSSSRHEGKHCSFLFSSLFQPTPWIAAFILPSELPIDSSVLNPTMIKLHCSQPWRCCSNFKVFQALFYTTKALPSSQSPEDLSTEGFLR